MANRLLRIALVILALSSTGCVGTGYFTNLAYAQGVTRVEGFKEPERVWVSRADGSVAIEVHSFLYTPDEGRKAFSKEMRVQPFEERFSNRPLHRRFLYASGDLMETLVAEEAERVARDRTIPRDMLSIQVYALPMQYRDEPPRYPYYWRVIPFALDAPDATDDEMPLNRPGGLESDAWEHSAANETEVDGERHYYYAWSHPVAWKSRDGRTWRLSFSLIDYPGVERHEHPPDALDWFRPVFWTADIVTSPIQMALGIVF